MLKKFRAKLRKPEGIGTWTYFLVPFQVEKVFGIHGQVKVRGTINGIPFHSSLFPRGDGRHYLVVRKSIRDQAETEAGKVVDVAMEKDTHPRLLRPPSDWRRFLSAHGKLQTAFRRLPKSHQKEYIHWISLAKKPETRKKRMMASMKRILLEADTRARKAASRKA